MLLTTELRPVFDESSKIAFSLFGLDVTWYALIILTGAIVGSIIGYFCFAKRLHFNSDLLFEGLALGLLFGVIGARLYYVLFYGHKFNSFWDMINPRNGGLAIHGALIATAIFLPIWCKLRHVKLLYLIEIAMPLIMLAQVFGRWGNFVNQEAFGSLIKYPGMVDNLQPLTDEALIAQRDFLHKLLIPNFIINRMYISSSPAAGFTVPGYYHPTFLYESILNLIGLSAYMIIRKYTKKIYVGESLNFYLIWYGIVRFFIESLRTDPLMFFNTNIKVAQLISVIFVVVGVTFFILRRCFKWKLISAKEALYGEGSSMMITADDKGSLEQNPQDTANDTEEKEKKAKGKKKPNKQDEKDNKNQ